MCIPGCIQIAMPLARASDIIESRSLPPVDLIFGRSPMMTSAREKLERVAKTTVPVLLQGESGTGKDIIAKLLHLQSSRSNSPWIKVTCPAIPDALIESELFGYERGAFTGASMTKRGRVELAHQGTLFLDEVGGLELGAQAKLLQVLQDGSFTRVGAQEPRKVNARLVCAANGDLRRQADNGSFRLDLLFRINAVTIDLPPLRQRMVDLPMLIDYFLDLHASAFRVKRRPPSRDIIGMMQRFNWPGNIRQLENMIRSYVLIGDEATLAGELLPSSQSEILPEIDLSNPISLKQITKTATQQLERQIILKVLQAHQWNRIKTAKWLNISYRSLLYKLQEAGVGANSHDVPKTEPQTIDSTPIPAAEPENEGAMEIMGCL
jgi:two-component system, NtrC family, response regulator AtoC